VTGGQPAHIIALQSIGLADPTLAVDQISIDSVTSFGAVRLATPLACVFRSPLDNEIRTMRGLMAWHQTQADRRVEFS
jgi:hypothetical protein